MEALFLLIAVSLLVALGFLGAFIWAVRSKQYEDDFTPSVRMLFESDTDATHSSTNSETTVKQTSK